MNRGPLMLGVMFAALYGPAFAADTTISTKTTTPLKTSTSGNITINQNISVTVATTGAVVTIDSNNSVSNGGLIQNTATGGGAIAVEILPGTVGSFLNDGSKVGVLNVPNAGLNNIGVLLAGSATGGLLPGNGTFTGDITVGQGTYATGTFAVTVTGPTKNPGTGPSAFGMDILSNLNGNLTFGGPWAITGDGVVALQVAGDINGVVDISGSANMLGTFFTSYTTDKVDPTTGSAALIGGNVTNGIMIAAGGGFINRSSLPTFRIAPSVITEAGGTNAHNIVLGDMPGTTGNLTGSINLSFANRGLIQVDESNTSDNSTDPGISTLAMRIGETGNSTSNLTTSLPSGFFNSGTVVSQSRSDQALATSATIGPTNATGIEIGKGVTLGVFSQSGLVGANGNVTVANVPTAFVSDTTHVVLDASASSVSSEYNGLPITWNGQTHTIVAYDGLTHVATVDSTFSSVAQPGNPYTIGYGSAFVNAAAITDPAGDKTVGSIKGGTGGAKGGVAIGLLIDAGNPAAPTSVPSLFNSGSIQAIAVVSDPSVAQLEAYAIKDLSGTLNTITNTGSITAAVSTLNSGAQKAVAIDISAGTVHQEIDINDAGSIVGDIRFGNYTPSGNATDVSILKINGNVQTTSGEVTTTRIANFIGNVTTANNTGTATPGSLDVLVSWEGTDPNSNLHDLGGRLQTANTQASNILVGANGQITIALNKNTDSQTPPISVTGLAGFAPGATLSVTPTTFLPLSSATPTAYSIIHSSAQGIVFSNADTVNNIAFPALLQGSTTCDGGTCENGILYSDVNATVRRKSAAELGLTGNAATIYEPLAAAALNDDIEGAALLRLSNQTDLQNAIEATVPDLSGGMRALTVAMTDQATGVIGSRQRSLVTSTAGDRGEFRFWGQEFYNNVSTPQTSTTPGYNGGGQGVSLGVEWGSLRTGRYGVGYTYFSSEETERRPRDTKMNGDWNMLTAYAGWRAGNAFFTPQLNLGSGSYLSRRLVNVVDSTTATSTFDGTVISRFAQGSWQGYLASGGGAAGYIIDFGAFQLIPEIALDALYVHQGTYTEAGAGGMNLILDPQNQQSLRSFAGVLAQGAFRLNDGNLQPQLLAGWSHEFMTSPATIDGSFESTPGSRFHLVGPMLDADKAIGGASVSYVFSNWQAGLNIDAARSQNTLTEAATISLSSRF